MLKSLFFFVAVFLVGSFISCSSPQPIRLHPGNPHYFQWHKKPILLIGSTEHYGAVLNLDFDFETYLQTLNKDGLNLTRTFSGIYCEHPGAFNIAENTLAPKEGKLICPWARSDEPGYKNGGNKFDLSRWDDAYFARLRDFVGAAKKYGVVVELDLFCTFYGEEQWGLSPINIINNVNGIGDVDRTEVFTLKDEKLTRVQDEMVRKIVVELNAFDNLYYEICNEPYFGGPTPEWQAHISALIRETESDLPNEHTISQNVANNSAIIANPDTNVDLFNFHYAFPSAIDDNYHFNNAFGDNETGFAGTQNQPYRLEAWNFILAGGALFNHLDYSFTADNEDGTFVFPSTQPGGGGAELRKQFHILKTFVEGLDFVAMQPMQEIFNGSLPGGIKARALGKTGEQYALYFSRTPQLQQNYSLRWSGRLTPKYSATYTFYTLTDDGARLWVNGKKLIDDWTSHAPLENSGRIELAAGKPVDIRMEFYQGAGGAKAELQWSSPGRAKELIAPEFFKLADGDAPGLKIEWFDDMKLDKKQAESVVFNVDFDGSLDRIFPAREEATAVSVALDVPDGAYSLSWIDPISGDVVKQENVAAAANGLTIDVPRFDTDIALKICK